MTLSGCAPGAPTDWVRPTKACARRIKHNTIVVQRTALGGSELGIFRIDIRRCTASRTFHTSHLETTQSQRLAAQFPTFLASSEMFTYPQRHRWHRIYLFL